MRRGEFCQPDPNTISDDISVTRWGLFDEFKVEYLCVKLDSFLSVEWEELKAAGGWHGDTSRGREVK